jgi:hypothetical protein
MTYQSNNAVTHRAQLRVDDGCAIGEPAKARRTRRQTAGGGVFEYGRRPCGDRREPKLGRDLRAMSVRGHEDPPSVATKESHASLAFSQPGGPPGAHAVGVKPRIGAPACQAPY